MNKRNIEQKAIYLLESTKYSSGEVDILTIAQSLGFVVGIAALPSNDNGFILIDHSKKQIYRIIGLATDKAIGVNVHLDLQTKRFIIAHEIGHAVLGHGSSPRTKIRYNQANFQLKEYEANLFAAELLMPIEAINYMIKQTEIGLKEMAEVFSVSSQALEIRLKRLGYLL